MGKEEAEEEQSKAVEEAPNDTTAITIGEQRKLASKIIRYDRSRKMFIIWYMMGKSGQRFVKFTKVFRFFT